MNIKLSQFVSAILLVEAILIYFFAPDLYNYNFNVFCAIQYAFVIGVYLLFKNKRNYFDFDCVFFTGYFFVTLFYPVFMYESDPTRFFMFQYDFDPNVIPQASALSVLGISSYTFGSMLITKKKDAEREISMDDFIPNNHLSFFALLTFILYVFTGGYAALSGAYSGNEVKGSPIASYIFVFTPAFLFSAIIIEFNNIKAKGGGIFYFKNVNPVAAFVALAFVVMILATGSRTLPMQVILLVGGLFTLFFRPVSFTRFILLVLAGMVFMFILVLARGYEQSGAFSVTDIAMDLIINNRNSYAAIEYVRNNGLTYGLSMTASLLGPFPFMQNLLITVFGVDVLEMSSSVVITKMTLGEVGELGLGTNIIADIYMSFGAGGVILLMTGLGAFISVSLSKARSNIYALVCYAILMSYAVFLVRAEFFFFLRFLLWALAIVYISKLYRIRFVLRKKE